VGNRAYGLVACDAPGGPPDFAAVLGRWVAYIPSHGAWASPAVQTTRPVAGVIYRPRTSVTDPYVQEVWTSCIS
jgi:hypothetical protein